MGLEVRFSRREEMLKEGSAAIRVDMIESLIFYGMVVLFGIV